VKFGITTVVRIEEGGIVIFTLKSNIKPPLISPNFEFMLCVIPRREQRGTYFTNYDVLVICHPRNMAKMSHATEPGKLPGVHIMKNWLESMATAIDPKNMKNKTLWSNSSFSHEYPR
jgi:hypothetical protein